MLKMIILEIPDNYVPHEDTIPRLTYMCSNTSTGGDVLCVDSVKIIDCILNTYHLNKLDWKAKDDGFARKQQLPESLIKDKELKSKIIDAAIKGQADIDGDVIVFEGNRYYVNLYKEIVEVIPE